MIFLIDIKLQLLVKTVVGLNFGRIVTGIMKYRDVRCVKIPKTMTMTTKLRVEI